MPERKSEFNAIWAKLVNRSDKLSFLRHEVERKWRCAVFMSFKRGEDEKNRSTVQCSTTKSSQMPTGDMVDH